MRAAVHFVLLAVLVPAAIVAEPVWPTGCSQEKFDLYSSTLPKCTTSPVGVVDAADKCTDLCVSYSLTVSEFCEEGGSGFGASTQTYCLCANSTAGLLVTDKGCAESICTGACLNEKVAALQVGVGLAITLFLCVIGEAVALFRGTCKPCCVPRTKKDAVICGLTAYGLYYIVWFLQCFDWMSDVAFIALDASDPDFEAEVRNRGYNYDAFFVMAIVLLSVTTVLFMVPTMLADCAQHHSRKEVPTAKCFWPWTWVPCKVPCSGGKTFSEIRIKPLGMMRLNMLVLISLELPQLIMQIFYTVVMSELSYVVLFSFIMTFLTVALTIGLAWHAIDEDDRKISRILVPKRRRTAPAPAGSLSEPEPEPAGATETAFVISEQPSSTSALVETDKDSGADQLPGNSTVDPQSNSVVIDVNSPP